MTPVHHSSKGAMAPTMAQQASAPTPNFTRSHRVLVMTESREAVRPLLISRPDERRAEHEAEGAQASPR